MEKEREKERETGREIEAKRNKLKIFFTKCTTDTNKVAFSEMIAASRIALNLILRHIPRWMAMKND